MTLEGPVEPELSWSRMCGVAAGRPVRRGVIREVTSKKPRSVPLTSVTGSTTSCGVSRAMALPTSWVVNR